MVTTLERAGPVEHALALTAGLVGAGDDVIGVCASPGIAERFAAAGAEPVIAPITSPGDIRGGRTAWAAARGADVVHAQDRRAGLWVRLGPRPRRGGIRVYTAHGMPEPYHPPPAGSGRPGWRARLAYRGLDAALCRRVDAIIVPSRAFAQLFVKQLGYPRDKTVVIPNGIDPPARLDRRGDLVGAVAVFEPYKGLDIFVRAAARVAANRPGQRFALFGSGSQEPALRRLVADVGLADRIDFPGFVPAEEALPQLSIYVMTSWFENCPIALLEAMALGIPVVATREYGVPEIATDGTALLPRPGDDAGVAAAIESLLDDAAAANRQADRARERILTSFTTAGMTAAIRGLYERLLAGSAR